MPDKLTAIQLFKFFTFLRGTLTRAIFEEKSARMPKIGQNSKTKTFLMTVEQNKSSDKWYNFLFQLFPLVVKKKISITLIYQPQNIAHSHISTIYRY